MGCGYRDRGDHETVTDQPATDELGERLARNEWTGYQQASTKSPFCRVDGIWGDRDSGVVEAQPPMHQWEPRLIYCFLGAK